MKKYLLSVAILIQTAAVSADEHLVPEDSVFSHIPGNEFLDDYHSSVRYVLAGAYDREVFARAIVLPSFQPEYAVAIARRDSDYKIIYLAPEVQIWQFESVKSLKSGEIRTLNADGELDNDEVIERLESVLPDSIEEVSVERCELEIDQDFGFSLFELWGEMMFAVRYVDRRPLTLNGEDTISVGLDGTTYHYSFDYGIDRLAGKIWSPDKNSVTGRFVSITTAMRKACLSKDQKLLATLKGEVANLRARLTEDNR